MNHHARRTPRVVKRPLYAADADERARQVEVYARRLREGRELWPQDDACREADEDIDR